MSFSCMRLTGGGSEISAEPVGDMVDEGFLPGTFVKFSSIAPTMNPNALATIERCNNTDWAVGFIIKGSMKLSSSFDNKYANDNEKNNIWTPDQKVAFLSENNAKFEMDDTPQLSYMGSGIVSINLSDVGAHKMYVYEKYNKAYRDGGGVSGGVSGGLIDWSQRIGYPGLYVSSRGLLTTEKEDVNSKPLVFVIASQGTDDNGEYILIVSA